MRTLLLSCCLISKAFYCEQRLLCVCIDLTIELFDEQVYWDCVAFLWMAIWLIPFVEQLHNIQQTCTYLLYAQFCCIYGIPNRLQVGVR